MNLLLIGVKTLPARPARSLTNGTSSSNRHFQGTLTVYVKQVNKDASTNIYRRRDTSRVNGSRFESIIGYPLESRLLSCEKDTLKALSINKGACIE